MPTSADKKPEKYTKPDGKIGIRMVPVMKDIDEISLDDLKKNIKTAGNYKKVAKAHGSDKIKKDLAMLRKGLVKESPEDMEPASPDEKSMAMRQAKFIQYVGEEIMEHLEQDNDFPEWMQNKLSALHQKAKDMHATMAGDYEDDEDENMNESYINEKLSVSDGMGAWIDDFKKSDAPQFKGKSEKERREMAIAAYLSAKRGAKNEGMTASQHRTAMLDKIKKSGAVKQGSMSKNESVKEEAELDEMNNNTIAALSRLKMAQDAEKKYRDSKLKKKASNSKTPQNKMAGKFDRETVAGLSRLKIAQDAEKKYRDSKLKKEEVEQLDELSPETLNRYKKKSIDDEGKRTAKHYDAVLGVKGKKPSWDDTQKTMRKIKNRVKGRKLANKKLGFDNNLYHDGKRLTNEEAILDEAAPKMKGDSFKQERERARKHDAAMGRTPTGRKKPVRQMTSTQRSLASLRKEEAELDERRFTRIDYKKHGKTFADLRKKAQDSIDKEIKNNPKYNSLKKEEAKPDAAEVMRKKQQMKNISTSDKDKLAKIRTMLNKEKK